MSKVSDVLAAMREAGGGREMLTAKWVELSATHTGLASALKAQFGRKPRTQQLGVWLSEHIGTKHGPLTLEGRHSGHAKAWRYRVRSDNEAAEAARAAAQREANRRAEADAAHRRALEIATAGKVGQAKTETIKEEIRDRMTARRERGKTDGFCIVAGTVQREVREAAQEPLDEAHTPPAEPAPPPKSERAFTVKPDKHGNPVKVYDLPLPAPKVAAPEQPTLEFDPLIARRALIDDPCPIWQREGRNPTRAEWAAHQRARFDPTAGSSGLIDTSISLHSPMAANGVRIGSNRRWSQDL